MTLCTSLTSFYANHMFILKAIQKLFTLNTDLLEVDSEGSTIKYDSSTQIKLLF